MTDNDSSSANFEQYRYQADQAILTANNSHMLHLNGDHDIDAPGCPIDRAVETG